MRKIVRISALLLMTLSAHASDKVADNDDSYKSKYFIDDDRCLWEMSGDFRQYKDLGNDADLCHQCIFKPVDGFNPSAEKQALESESNAFDPVSTRLPAVKIQVLGYKDHTVRIWLQVPDDFRIVSKIGEDLNSFKFVKQCSYLKNVFYTDEPDSFESFLTLLERHNLLTPKVKDRVLKIARTPKHTYGLPNFRGERRMWDLEPSIREPFSGEIPGLGAASYILTRL